MTMNTIKFRNLISFVAIFILGVTTIHAQKEGIRFGVQAGVNAADVFNEDFSAIRAGYTLSAIVEIPLLKNRLSIQPELAFSMLKEAVIPLHYYFL